MRKTTSLWSVYSLRWRHRVGGRMSSEPRKSSVLWVSKITIVRSSDFLEANANVSL